VKKKEETKNWSGARETSKREKLQKKPIASGLLSDFFPSSHFSLFTRNGRRSFSL